MTLGTEPAPGLLFCLVATQDLSWKVPLRPIPLWLSGDRGPGRGAARHPGHPGPPAGSLHEKTGDSQPPCVQTEENRKCQERKQTQGPDGARGSVWRLLGSGSSPSPRLEVP